MKKQPITLLSMWMQNTRMLKEVGDLENIEAYPYQDNSFTTDENWKVLVTFSNMDTEELDYLNLQTDSENTYYVGYSVNGIDSQYKKTTYKQLIRILKTVSNIVKDFVKNNRDVEALVFTAANKDPEKLLTTTDPQKSAIYKTIIVKNLTGLDKVWKLRELRIGDEALGFALVKDK